MSPSKRFHGNSRSIAKRVSLFLCGTCLLLTSVQGQAFPHVVQEGETLAALARRYYGRLQFERTLVTANGLGNSSAAGIVPGMILEIPALTYAQVKEGDTWKDLAERYLGAQKRAFLLAELNGHKPWIPPEVGQLIAIPYNLAWVASGDESLATLSYRYLGSTKHTYRLVLYNDLKGDDVNRGDILLIPLTNLPLTLEGQHAAELAAARVQEQGQRRLYERQRSSQQETRMLHEDVRGGRYISAVIRGTELLSIGRLSEPSRAAVQLLLLEAYVALDEKGAARSACQAWRQLVPDGNLDPLMTSPKILAMCPRTLSPEPAAEDSDEPE